MSDWFYTNTWGTEIASVTIDKFTDASVWVKGQRRARQGLNEMYSPTWEEAHAFLTEYWNAQLGSARRQLEYVNGRVGNVKGMTKAALRR